MGYTLTIGELRNDGAEEITLAQAPTFTGDEPTGRSNKRMMSYSAFADFCTRTGLGITLSPVKRQHPGHLEITEALVNQVEQALHTYEARHWLPTGFGFLHDSHRARLRWLSWWMQWAWQNCQHPTLANR